MRSCSEARRAIWPRSRTGGGPGADVAARVDEAPRLLPPGAASRATECSGLEVVIGSVHAVDYFARGARLRGRFALHVLPRRGRRSATFGGHVLERARNAPRALRCLQFDNHFGACGLACGYMG